MNEIATKLEAAAALAKSLADDVRAGSLWEGDLINRISEINAQMTAARLMAERKEKR